MFITNLLELNVDMLFEQHGVAEIDGVHRQIEAEVDKKREELRTMVGERYRDLLKAADTIAAMQSSSETLIAQLERITSNCCSLKDQQLIGFKTTTDTSDLVRTRSANKQLHNYFGTMVQVKMLIALPGLIWTHLDAQHFCKATQLLVFGRHISTGLQLDAHNVLMRSLPVAKKQWETLKPFQATIKQRILSVLEQPELQVGTATDCLLSLLLLEKCSLQAALQTFLQLRSKAFEKSLRHDEDDEEDVVPLTEQEPMLKARILNSLRLLNWTVELINSCFLESGLLFEKLQEFMDPTAAPTIMLFDSTHTQFAHILPDIIANFRVKFDAQTLQESDLRIALESWLTQVSQIAHALLQPLFARVRSMSTIQEVKQDGGTSSNCTHGARFGLKQSLNFYQTLYLPLVTQRVRDILQRSWEQAITESYAVVQHSLAAVPETSDSSLAAKFFEDDDDDLPQSLAEAHSENLLDKKLLLQLKGYDEHVLAVCRELDRHLGSIYAQFEQVLQEPQTTLEEKQVLVDFMRNLADKQLQQFISRIKQFELEEKRQRRQLLLIVRLFSALMELCANLKCCFSVQLAAAGAILTHKSTENWQQFCQSLEQEVLELWQRIIEDILKEQPVDEQLPKDITLKVQLNDFMIWEEIVFEQKDESGENAVIQSKLRIPNQPSISLQEYLFKIISSICNSVPQTLPQCVLLLLNNKMLLELLQHYEALNIERQPVALQIYFDLKLLQQLFGVTREDREIYERMQQLGNKLREHIDPFDFELFAERLAQNIKRAAARLSLQMGVIIPPKAAQQLASIVFAELPQEKEPNILNLCSDSSTPIWFPLLPIVETEISSPKKQHAVQSIKTEEDTSAAATAVATPTQTTSPRKSSSTARKSETTKQKSGGMSFFGAMSQDWFR